PLAHAHDAEAAAFVEGHADGVLGEDAGLDRPDAGFFRTLYEGAQKAGADAASPRRLGHVDAVLRHAGVAATIGDGRDRGPADDLAVQFGDETPRRAVGAVPVLPGRTRCFA